MNWTRVLQVVSTALLLAENATQGFIGICPTQSMANTNASPSLRESLALFMGRAAAVRASTKAKTDAKKAKTNAVYGKKIIMAVKQGGSDDPNANRLLGDLIKQAKANSVPVDNIQRAIKKATEGNVGDFKEKTFEAYGLGGASMIISVLTDNDNRATADVKSTVNKRNGKIAEQGSVAFMYDRKAIVEFGEGELDEEALLEAAIDAGCEDYEEKNVTEKPSLEISYISKAPVEVSDEEFEKNMEIIDALEELDDVDDVHH
eukprot:CAMPEP_0168745390 /NCGR_PEP_ID=MMETSP0724-20121128/14587_1 /TAXON_ID=265536 /ORGANISM="Amphiprora sp., Strain CCMP467" /LENGTH=260 /DNA_ID=CAMNT_0008793089 /DNA_START=40 /DNA_END=820 /DNA_ORIENTATION=+